jgi:hypothetical protein
MAGGNPVFRTLGEVAAVSINGGGNGVKRSVGMGERTSVN